MKTKFVIVEGNHAAGKSTQTDALAKALRDVGLDAQAWHHKSIPDAPTPYAAALEYAAQRARLLAWCAREGPDVLVMDRGAQSSAVVARTLRIDLPRGAPECLVIAERDAIERLVIAERVALPRALRVFVLDTADEVLDARLTARGATVTAVDRDARPWYRNARLLREWRAVQVDTTGDTAATTARLAGMTLVTLERFDDAIELWHKSPGDLTVYEWLGMTPQAYARRVEGRRCVECGRVAFPGCCEFTRRKPGDAVPLEVEGDES